MTPRERLIDQRNKRRRKAMRDIWMPSELARADRLAARVAKLLREQKEPLECTQSCHPTCAS